MNERAEKRLLGLLERLFAIPPAALDVVLNRGADLIHEATGCEKVDVFLYEPPSNCLVAIGTAHTKLAQLQKSLGLDRLPVANGDPVAKVCETGAPYLCGAVETDPTQPRGVVEGMGARSMLAVAFDVGEKGRGVLSLMSRRADAFGEDDLSWLKITGAWIGNLVHRSELTEAYATKSSEQAKRGATEELITVLAHDLRNLLGPVVTRLTLLQEHSREIGHAENVEHCVRALNGLELVSELMSDLLDVARIEQGMMSLSYQKLDIVALARTIAQALTTPAVPIEVDSYVSELRVVGDRIRLGQAFENILSNATKHSPRGVPVVMQLRQIKQDVGDAVAIQVIDRGAGITPELLPRVFERFVRAGPRSGLGLGLYLARATIAAHGGSIELSSTLGQGTRCEIILPTTPLGTSSSTA